MALRSSAEYTKRYLLQGMDMILVLGAGSYIGRLFCAELRRRGRDFTLVAAKDYTDFDTLFDCIRKTNPEFIINASGCCAGADWDVCELAREETLHANTILPHIIAKVCLMTNTAWGHISSCAIYCGAKVASEEGLVVEKRMNGNELLRLLAAKPERVHGYSELDEPNFSFRNIPCSFFSGTAALGEEAIRGIGANYIWRLGLPFNERDEPENILHRLQNDEKIYPGVNPLSHTDDFVRACLDLRELQAPYGIYNVAHPGIVTTRQITEMLAKILKPGRALEFWEDEAEYYRDGKHALRPNCVVDVSKLAAVGIVLRPAAEAVEDSLRHWSAAPFSEELHRAAA
ncbi:MAG TPA: sugar nucleotide-binding protein [Verrucomicrobiae bacterium]|nr:sugar nucleotide-binding protein [Verrucomicrobiae bacterium]